MYLRKAFATKEISHRTLGLGARSAAVGLMTALSSVAVAQEAPQPAPASDAMALPAVEVTATTAKKKVAKKSAAKKAAPSAAAPLPGLPTSSASNSASAAGTGSTKPGLNLDTPAATSSRLGLTPLETPASVEVISGDTIRERGQTSVNEAVTQNATGFTSSAAPGNGGSSLSVRGFVGHSSVMRLYDGTRLYAGAGTVTFPFNTWNAERIEVLRGPASVLYGEGAIGGVINVVPKKPTDYFTSEGEVAIGTDGQRRFGVGAGGPASDRLSYRFDIAGAQGDGWKSPNGEWSELAMSGAVKLKAAPGLTFTLSHDYGDQHPMPYFGTPLAANERRPELFRDKNFNVADSKVDYIDNWTQFKTEWQVNETVTLRNVAYYMTTDRHWRNIERYAFNANTGRIDRSDYLEIYHEQEQVGNRFDATVKHDILGMKNDIVVGFDVNRIKFTGISNSPYIGSSSIDPWNFDPGSFYDPAGQAPTIPRSSTETFQYALFAEDRLALTDQLSIVGGIRFERPTIDRTDLISGARVDKDFAATTWRAGVVYTPVEGLAFYGQYATGIDPLGNLVTLSPSDAKFDLATGRQIEVGVKQSFWGGRGEWTLAFYDIEKQNTLTPDPNKPNTSLQIGQQSSRGVEFSAAAQLTDTLRAEGNIAVLEAQYDVFNTAPRVVGGQVVQPGASYAGNVPTNVPEQVANVWLKWAFMPRWEAYAGVRWVGKTYNDSANLSSRPDYWVVNAGLSYAVTANSTLSLRGYNLFDEIYAYGGSANSDGTTRSWNLAPPRSAELSYRVRF